MKYLDLDCLINLHKNNFGNIELLASIWFIFNWPPYGETIGEAVFFHPPLFLARYLTHLLTYLPTHLLHYWHGKLEKSGNIDASSLKFGM